jgi:hypothetical protein
LRTLLRAHAPDAAAAIDQVLQHRGELLRNLADDLERCWAEGGLGGVDELLDALDQNVAELTRACEQLGTFIATRFPIGR